MSSRGAGQKPRNAEAAVDRGTDIINYLQKGAPMPNMQFANNGAGNDAGPAETTLTSTNTSHTLLISNTSASGRGLTATANGVGVSGQGFGNSAGVFGVNHASGNGIAGRSDARNGVQGESSSQSASGVYG